MFRDGLRIDGIDRRVSGTWADGDVLTVDGDTIIAGTGGPTSGTATLDFGATFTDTATVTLTGLTWVTATSAIEVWMMGSTTADSTAAEHEYLASTCSFVVVACVAGVGFTIDAHSHEGFAKGQFTVYWEPVFKVLGSGLSSSTAVEGPSSATDEAIARFDGTTGKLVQNSATRIDDSGNIITSADVFANDLIGTGNVYVVDVVATGWLYADNAPVMHSGHRMQGPQNQSPAGGKLLVSDTAYWCWLGWVQRPIYIQNFSFYVTVAGAGAQTAEVCLASSVDIPNFGGQSLTKLYATNDLQSLTSTGAKGCNSFFTAFNVASGVNLWAGIRTAMATTQPTIAGFNFDQNYGEILSTAAAGALTGAGPWTGAVIAASSPAAAADCPNIGVYFGNT